MEDFERLQHREYQRQQLLEELKRMIWGAVSEEDISGEHHNEDCFFWGLASATTTYFSTLNVEFEREVRDVFYSSSIRLFKASMLPKIEEFTPVIAERKLLAAELLKYATEELSRCIHREMLRLSVPPGRDEYLKQTGLDKLEAI